MACAGCRKKANGTIYVQGAAVPIPTGPDRVFVYVGPRAGQFTVNSAMSPRKFYRVRQGEPFVVPAADAVARFSRLKDFQEVIPEPEVPGTAIPAQPVQPPEIVIPQPQPAPEVAEVEEMAPPERADDLDRLGLHHTITDALRSANIHTVDDLAFFVRANGGQTVRNIKGIASKRFDKIVAAIKTLEAA